jgi:hypothetical protein
MQELSPFSPFEDLLSQGPKPWTVEMLEMFFRKDKTPRALCDDNLGPVFKWKDTNTRDAVLELYVREGLYPNDRTLGLTMQAHVPFWLLERMLRSGFDIKHVPLPHEPKFAFKYYQYRLITDYNESVLHREGFLFAVASFCKYPYQDALRTFFSTLKVEYKTSKEKQLREYKFFSDEERSKVCGPAPNALNPLPPIKARVDFLPTAEITPMQLLAEQDRYTSIVIPDLRHALAQQEKVFLPRTIRAFNSSDFSYESGICLFWRQQLANAEATLLHLKLHNDMGCDGQSSCRKESGGRKRKASQDLTQSCDMVVRGL